ncbi:MAG TPA: ATP-binding protein [Candidatus Dormibacteraeota bacterium]|jgi:two-component system phosphate regulon sensor histidine kinase PhoR|nr:ATP-binding protein [Candidatus Dormibacteraeota bacterium]
MTGVPDAGRSAAAAVSFDRILSDVEPSDWAASMPLADVLAEVLEGSDEGLLVVDDDGLIRFASPTALRHLELRPNAIGTPIAEAHGDYRLVRLLTSAAGTDEVIETHWSTTHRELSARARRLSRPAEGVLVWVRDETRMRHLEKMRRDFISNVSHELRTPLAAMRVMAETLLAGALHDGPAAQEFVHRIGLEVEQMSQMVEELLELSALEGEERPVPDEAVPVVDLLIAIDRLRPLIESKNINLVFDVPADIPPIRGDVTHLQNVLRNLVHNAVKFTPPRGAITVAAAVAGNRGERVELRCTDTGVGIRSDDLTRIFERFWKADSSRRRDGEGSGLGLAIARHVVAAHQGTIRVESELGRGSSFVVVLPRWAGSDAAIA